MPMLNLYFVFIFVFIIFCAINSLNQQECVSWCMHFSCMSWCKHSAASGELTRRLPSDPVDSDHPGLSWYACRAALTWGGQQSRRSGSIGRGQKDQQAMNEWIIIMTGAILLSSATPPQFPAEAMALALHGSGSLHGLVIWIRSAWVKYHHQARSGLSAVEYDMGWGGERWLL